jgi:hypothetical protein
MRQQGHPETEIVPYLRGELRQRPQTMTPAERPSMGQRPPTMTPEQRQQLGERLRQQHAPGETR